MDISNPPVTQPIRTLPVSLNKLNPIATDDLLRLGTNLDGGYIVVRSAVLAADALLSFGLGFNWSFEEDVAKLNPDLTIHVYDNSITDRTYLDMIVSCWNNIRRAQGSLSEVRSTIEFYESYRRFFQDNRVHFRERIFDRNESREDVTVDEAIARLGDKQRLLLKMDIDGGEYRIIENLLVYQNRIPLMVIEFHATEFLRETFLARIEQILKHYEIVHIHGNNAVGVAPDGLPDVLEVTFLQKSLCTATSRRNRLPIAGLDFANMPNRPDHKLIFSDSNSDAVT